jgi:hypothetical protein
MPRNGGCGKVRISAWPLDQYVDAKFWDRQDVQAHEREAPQHDADAGPLIRELAEAEARLSELRDAYADGSLRLDDFKSMSEGVRARMQEAEQRLRDVQPEPPPGDPFVRAADLYDRWKRRALTQEEVADLNDMYQRWIERIVVKPAMRLGRASVQDIPKRVRIVWQ